MISKLSYFQYKSYTKLSYLYCLYDKNFQTFNTSHTPFRCRATMSARGICWVLRTQIGALPFQFGNCQRATCIRGIAASQLETHFPSSAELVVVGTGGQTQENLEVARN